jgi:hypothetical protein
MRVQRALQGGWWQIVRIFLLKTAERLVLRCRSRVKDRLFLQIPRKELQERWGSERMIRLTPKTGAAI